MCNALFIIISTIMFCAKQSLQHYKCALCTNVYIMIITRRANNWSLIKGHSLLEERMSSFVILTRSVMQAAKKWFSWYFLPQNDFMHNFFLVSLSPGLSLKLCMSSLNTNTILKPMWFYSIQLNGASFKLQIHSKSWSTLSSEHLHLAVFFEVFQSEKVREVMESTLLVGN